MIICGFPGVGKSSVAERHPNSVLDAESSNFHNENGSLNVKAYVDYIIENKNKYKYVLTACHKEVRQELAKRNEPYLIVMPQKEDKNVYMTRFLQRGNSIEFITKLYNNWDRWFYEVEYSKDELAPIIYLDKFQYIEHILFYNWECYV